MNSQKAPHSSPLQVSYGVSIVHIWEKQEFKTEFKTKILTSSPNICLSLFDLLSFHLLRSKFNCPSPIFPVLGNLTLISMIIFNLLGPMVIQQ